MTNSDNTYGVHNKITKVCTQTDDGSTALINFSDVAAAKAHFFTDEALTVFDECCTQLQWALVDANTLKYTMAFGVQANPSTKGWGDLFLERRQALIDSNGWNKASIIPIYVESTSSDHLF